MERQTQENDMTVYAAMYKAAYFLKNGFTFGQKRTAKRLFAVLKDYLNARAIIGHVNIKIQSIFFDSEKKTLFLYCTNCTRSGTLKDVCFKATANTGASFCMDCEEEWQGIATKITLWLNHKLNSQLDIWQQLAVYTQALRQMHEYKTSARALTMQEKKRIANSKRQSDRFYGHTTNALWKATDYINR